MHSRTNSFFVTLEGQTVKEKRLKQKPIRKGEASADIVIAYYPRLAEAATKEIEDSIKAADKLGKKKKTC